MSETFWLALVGILGTICAGLLPPLLQRRHDRQQLVLDLLIRHQIECLTNYRNALQECETLISRTLTEIESLDQAIALYTELEPKMETVEKAGDAAGIYLDIKAYEALHEAYLAIYEVWSNLRTVITSNNIRKYSKSKQADDWARLVNATRAATTHISTKLNPTILQNLYKTL
jgi:type II secretory pathway pseudopilin PulG